MITPDIGPQWIGDRYWRPRKFFGLSTDTKPTEDIANGSVFIEMDTSKLYFFNFEDTEWLEWGGE